MNRVDVVAVLLFVAALFGGWRSGFVRRILSWLGLVAGLWLGTRVVPWFLDTSDGTVMLGPREFMVAATVLVLCAALGQLIGAIIGSRLRSWVTKLHLGRADQFLGSVAAGVGIVFMAWIVLPVMAQVPGWPSAAARESTVARWIDSGLGRPPRAFDGIAKALGVNRLPNVFEELARSPEVGPPPATTPAPQEVLDAAIQSVVRIAGPSCNRLQSGSGAVVGPDLVVTNAHVVAGMREVRVETVQGARRAGQVIAFDPRNDLALVSVRDLGRPPLEMRSARDGEVGAALGFPGGGDLKISPFRVERHLDAFGRDIYDEARVRRNILVLAAQLEPGDSGGPLIAPDGALIGVSFAVAPDQPDTSYAIRTEDVQALLLATRVREPVAVGPCTG